jgi:hypothetical protein
VTLQRSGFYLAAAPDEPVHRQSRGRASGLTRPQPGKGKQTSNPRKSLETGKAGSWRLKAPCRARHGG